VDSGSVTQWLQSLRQCDERSAEDLWQRYFQKLVAVAGARLRNVPQGIADAEDVALSVFDALVRGAAKGRFPNLHDRHDLWALMLAITKNKTVDLMRRERRTKSAGNRVGGEVDDGPEAGTRNAMTLDDLCGDEPTPDLLAILDEEHQNLLRLLRDDSLRQVANQTLEGYSNQEIAGRLNVSARTVQRKLVLIRETWSRALLLS